MHKYVTEFIGTFFLVLAVCLCVVYAGNLAPIGIGLALMVMVYMGGHVSGAHYNPAVTVALLLRKKVPVTDVIPYMAAQVGGALAAAAIAKSVSGQTILVAPAATANIPQALLVEALFTFALALVVLNVAASAKTKGNSFYGAAIGLTITAAAFAGGPISGGAFNPAVGLGTTIMHAIFDSGPITHVWIYIVGPIAGGVAAASVFAMQEEAPV